MDDYIEDGYNRPHSYERRVNPFESDMDYVRRARNPRDDDCDHRGANPGAFQSRQSSGRHGIPGFQLAEAGAPSPHYTDGVESGGLPADGIIHLHMANEGRLDNRELAWARESLIVVNAVDERVKSKGITNYKTDSEPAVGGAHNGMKSTVTFASIIAQHKDRSAKIAKRVCCAMILKYIQPDVLSAWVDQQGMQDPLQSFNAAGANIPVVAPPPGAPPPISIPVPTTSSYAPLGPSRLPPVQLQAYTQPVNIIGAPASIVPASSIRVPQATLLHPDQVHDLTHQSGTVMVTNYPEIEDYILFAIHSDVFLKQLKRRIIGVEEEWRNLRMRFKDPETGAEPEYRRFKDKQYFCSEITFGYSFRDLRLQMELAYDAESCAKAACIAAVDVLLDWREGGVHDISRGKILGERGKPTSPIYFVMVDNLRQRFGRDAVRAHDAQHVPLRPPMSSARAFPHGLPEVQLQFEELSARCSSLCLGKVNYEVSSDNSRNDGYACYAYICRSGDSGAMEAQSEVHDSVTKAMAECAEKLLKQIARMASPEKAPGERPLREVEQERNEGKRHVTPPIGSSYQARPTGGSLIGRPRDRSRTRSRGRRADSRGSGRGTGDYPGSHVNRGGYNVRKGYRSPSSPVGQASQYADAEVEVEGSRYRRDMERPRSPPLHQPSDYEEGLPKNDHPIRRRDSHERVSAKTAEGHEQKNQKSGAGHSESVRNRPQDQTEGGPRNATADPRQDGNWRNTPDSSREVGLDQGVNPQVDENRASSRNQPGLVDEKRSGELETRSATANCLAEPVGEAGGADGAKVPERDLPDGPPVFIPGRGEHAGGERDLRDSRIRTKAPGPASGRAVPFAEGGPQNDREPSDEEGTNHQGKKAGASAEESLVHRPGSTAEDPYDAGQANERYLAGLERIQKLYAGSRREASPELVSDRPDLRRSDGSPSRNLGSPERRFSNSKGETLEDRRLSNRPKPGERRPSVRGRRGSPSGYRHRSRLGSDEDDARDIRGGRRREREERDYEFESRESRERLHGHPGARESYGAPKQFQSRDSLRVTESRTSQHSRRHDDRPSDFEDFRRTREPQEPLRGREIPTPLDYGRSEHYESVARGRQGSYEPRRPRESIYESVSREEIRDYDDRGRSERRQDHSGSHGDHGRFEEGRVYVRDDSEPRRGEGYGRTGDYERRSRQRSRWAEEESPAYSRGDGYGTPGAIHRSYRNAESYDRDREYDRGYYDRSDHRDGKHPREYHHAGRDEADRYGRRGVDRGGRSAGGYERGYYEDGRSPRC